MGQAIGREDFYQMLEAALPKEGTINDETARGLSFELDSMGVVMVLTYFDDELGLVLDAKALANCHSVADIMNLVGPDKFGN